MIILGIDPGTAILGWSVLQKEKAAISLLSCDSIQTTPDESEAKRLVLLYDAFTKLIRNVSPDVASIEQIYFTSNVKTAIPVAQARGVILLACAQHNIPVVSYSPSQIKKTITGDGTADKRQIQFMLKQLLPRTKLPKLDDVSDAIAIALTHAYTKHF